MRLPRQLVVAAAAAVVVMTAMATMPNDTVVEKLAGAWQEEVAAAIADGAVRELPAPDDWIDRGEIFEQGTEGEWDRYLWGGFAASPVLLEGRVHLYYQGARGYRTAFDETVTWRAVGLATSNDGIRFHKFDRNPVITWFPGEEEEEGAASAAAIATPSGEIAVYYGANTAESKTAVSADARLAWSSDGRAFEDRGVVLDHADSRVWGSGDELFPVAAIVDDGQWIVYYLPNGTLETGQLGVAWGPRPDDLADTAEVTSPTGSVQAWGPASAVRIGDGSYALFTSSARTRRIEARLFHADTPWLVTDPVEVYAWDEVLQGVVLYDPAARAFRLYYRTGRSYGVKTAMAR